MPTSDRPGDLLRRLPPRFRQAALLTFDAGLAVGSLVLAMQLRFDGAIPEEYDRTIPLLAALLAACRVAAGFGLRLHRWSFRFSGLADAARIGVAGLFGSIAFVGFTAWLVDPRPPRSVLVLELLLSTLLITGMRFARRLANLYVGDWVRSRQDGAVRTLIVGAGSAGEMLLRDLRQSGDHSYRIVGFVDDDRSKLGTIVGGRSVLGTFEDLPRLARQYRAEQVLIAIPRLAGSRVREILALCAEQKLRFKILPVSFAYFSRRNATAVMQDLSPADLLPRESIELTRSGPPPFEGAITLVTGAAGSIGSEICRQLAAGGVRRLVMIDQDESGLYMLARQLGEVHPDVELVPEIGDICDAPRMASILRRERPRDVFHAAANKHVPLMEDAPGEAVKTNVEGTRIVADRSAAAGVARFVLISTDKAVRPTSVMGATKRLCEEIVRDRDRRSDTQFCAVRFGNVLGSAGSVVPLFQRQISTGGPVTVTHPEVRRYFMTIREAVSLVLHAAYSEAGNLYVLDMGEQIPIVDLARHMITMAGLTPDRDIAIRFVGLRPGEKLSEELMTDEEERTRQVDHKILLAVPPPPRDGLDAEISRLIEAARAEDPLACRRLLHRLVPGFPAAPAFPAAPDEPPSKARSAS